MHQLNVLILGSQSFILTLNELKPFLKFNPHSDITAKSYDVVLFQDNALTNQQYQTLIKKTNALKLYAHNKINNFNNYDGFLQLPTSINEINQIVENLIAKKTFDTNSSIQINDYLLNKNEKKLIKDNSYIILTEKEIQLIELFLLHKKPISKNKILSLVWNYSSEADTHTVETHIYRLRKKINEIFDDDKFIINNKDGYYL
jgi:hypothetical protein